MEDRIVPASRLFAIPPGAVIHELNPTTGAVINTIPAPEGTTNGQNGLAFDGTRLFFINGGGSDRLYELNPDTGAVINNDPITVGSGAYGGLAVVAGQVYIEDDVANLIFAFDPVSDTITATLNPGVDLVGGLTGASNPGALIGPINGGNLIAEINPTTGAVTSTFQPGFPNILGAAVVGNEIYLGSGATNTIFRYTRTGMFLGQIQTAFPMAALGSDDTTGAPAPPAPGAQFINGNFEAGNVSGWTVFNQQPAGAASPGFQAYTGPNPLGSQLPAPPQGNFAAFVNHNNPGSYILYQDVTLPAGQFHTLSLQVYYNNLAGQFVTPNTLSAPVGGANQQFRIDIITPGGDLLSTTTGVLLNVFRTNVGAPNFQAPTTLSADLTAFAGQTVRLRIAVADTLAPLFGAVDDVKITSSETAPTGIVAGVKFNDLDGNGAQNAGEPGLPGWTIYADLNNNRQLDASEPSTVTGPNGAYTLTLAPGAYTIREVPQTGWVQTAPTYERFFVSRVGNAGGPQFISELNASGVATNTFTAPVAVQVQGPQGLASSGDSLFYIDGTQALNTTGTHTLYELDPATGAVLDSDILPATAEIAGLAYLGGMVYIQVHPTNQILVFDPATDTVVRTFTIGADIIGGLAGAPDLGLLFTTANPGLIIGVNPQTGAVVRTLNPSVGFFTGGLAYYHGELIASTGSPTVFRINLQTGTVLGTLNLTGIGSGVTGLGGDGRVGGGQRVSVAANQTVNIAFGNRRDEGTVSGVKFNDLNGNGTRDGNEPGLSGWTIYADLNNNRQLDASEPSTVTGTDGTYTLTVPSGFQLIREVTQPGWVQTSPFGYTLYATALDGTQLITVNPATGASTVIGPFGFSQTSSLAFSPPDGTIWTIVNPFNASQAQLARVDPATGAATPVGSVLWTGSPMIAIEVDAAGNLYGGNASGQFFRLDKTTGAATLIGSLGVQGVLDFAFDRAGALWAINSTSQLFRLDPATGTSVFVTNIVNLAGLPQGLMIHPGTDTFYLTTTASILHTLNPVTGVATPQGSFNGVPVTRGGDFAVENGFTVGIVPGISLSVLAFGNRRDEGTVSGVKFNDLNGNGTRDGNEPGLSGWTIYADLNNNGRLDTDDPSTVTGPDGSYQLTLPSGSYSIHEVPQAGWIETTPTGDRLFALRPTSPQTLNIVELDPLGFPINTFPAPAAITGVGPQGLAVGRNSLFYIDGSAPSTGTRTLYELDPFTGAVIDTDTLPTGAPVSALGYLDGLVYVLGTANQILVFNPDTDTVVRTLTPATGSLLGGLTGAADLGLLFATSGGQVAAINPVTGAVVRILAPATGPFVGGIAYRRGELLGVPFSSGSAPIVRVDPVTGQILGALAAVGPTTSGLGGDGPHPGAARITITPGAALGGRDFGNQQVAPPTATDDTGTVNEDAVLNVPARGVLANDTGAFGAKAVVAVNGIAAAVGQTLTLPSGALLRVNSDGSYTYIPGSAFGALLPGQSTTDSFTYTMADGTAATASASVTITISGANDAPTAQPDTFATNEDDAITGNLLVNDIDPDVGDTSTVIEVNGSAVAVGQTITLVSGARLTVRADGNFDYDPSGAWDQLAAGQTGVDRFIYRMADAAGATSQTSVTINLTGVNDAPVGVNDTAETDEDTPLVATVPGVLGNDTDVDIGDTRTVVAVNGSTTAVGQTVTLSSGARLTLRADGSYDYDPTGAFDFLRVGESALDVVEYTLADVAGATATAALTFTVRGLNDSPVASPDDNSTDEDTVLRVSAPGLLGDDTDSDHDAVLTVVEVNAGGEVGQPITLASGAIVTVFADGSYDYDPNGAFEALAPGATATDTFTYRVSDGSASDVATVTITINGVNDAPVAGPDDYFTDEDTALVVLAAGVLANDTDVDGGPLTAALASAPTNGTVTVNPDGSFAYRPSANFNGTDTFRYTVSDGRGGTAVGTVTITVRPVNDAPTLAGATFTVPENSPNGTVVGTVAGADVDGDTLTYRIVGGNTGGAFAINPATGRLTVANATALDFETIPTFSLTIEVRDAAGLTATATVTVRLSNVIEPRIDIKPNDSKNQINHRSHGRVEVAILSTYEFNALWVNPFTLRFGRTGQEDSLSSIAGLIPRVRYTDVNHDGRLDMVVEFEIEETGFRPGDTKGILTGEFWDGTAFRAEDFVSIR